MIYAKVVAFRKGIACSYIMPEAQVIVFNLSKLSLN